MTENTAQSTFVLSPRPYPKEAEQVEEMLWQVRRRTGVLGRSKSVAGAGRPRLQSTEVAPGSRLAPHEVDAIRNTTANPELLAQYYQDKVSGPEEIERIRSQKQSRRIA